MTRLIYVDYRYGDEIIPGISENSTDRLQGLWPLPAASTAQRRQTGIVSIEFYRLNVDLVFSLFIFIFVFVNF